MSYEELRVCLCLWNLFQVPDFPRPFRGLQRSCWGALNGVKFDWLGPQNGMKFGYQGPQDGSKFGCHGPQNAVKFQSWNIKILIFRNFKSKNTFRTNTNAKWTFGQNTDKGSGIIMLDYNEYMKAWYAHLTTSQSQNNKYSIILSFYYTLTNTIGMKKISKTRHFFLI